jgi:hypothetical protein
MEAPVSRHEHEQLAALEEALTDEERRLLDDLAAGIERRGLTPVALFFLESMKPLGYVSSQVMHFFRPIISVLWEQPVKYDLATKILERRGSIELLLRRLERGSP